MSIETAKITVNGIAVDLVRKPIKNLHLGVYPPNGRVRVAAPLAMGDEAVRLAVVTRLGWIKRQRGGFDQQDRQSAREYVSGESHYFLGRRYRLDVILREGPARVIVTNRRLITVMIAPDNTLKQRARAVSAWYRQELKALAAPLIEKWAASMRLAVPQWRIRRMKTRWGTCDPDRGRVCINLELAKKPRQCLEYIIVHELAHFFERHHTDRFAAVMSRYLPQWELLRDELNCEPLAHETWKY